MNSMAINRRQALALLASAALRPGAALARGGRSMYLSALTTSGWNHGAALLDSEGRILARFELPSRGHGAAVVPRATQAVIFARRPGTHAIVIDIAPPRVAAVIESRGDRHFYGHGCFSPDGRLLYATENDFDGERGVLGVYDARDGYRRVGELPTHGIGPHEVVFMPDGRTLAVANGGILTHPSAPRVKQNLGDMSPSLALIDASHGELLSLHQAGPDLNRLSIRHLAGNRQGRIAVAMQWEGPAGDMPPLVAIWRPGGDLRLVSAPADIQRSMRNYCGSVAFAADGERFLVSAPRGDMLTEWRVDGKFCRSWVLRDGCAVAPFAEDGFRATGGHGDVVALDRAREALNPLAQYREIMWDNHMTSLERRPPRAD